MYSKVPKRSLVIAFKQFLVRSIINNDVERITSWVEENIIKDHSYVEAFQKMCFYEAEKDILTEYIVHGFNEQFNKLLNSIDNEKFDREFKEYPNYPKLKANQCIVLSDVIIECKNALEQDNAMQKKIVELLSSKYQTLLDNNYDVSKITRINMALQTVHHEEFPVSPLASTSGASDQ